MAAQTSGEPALICHYTFDQTLLDASENQFDAVADAGIKPAYQTSDALHREGTAALMINSSSSAKRYLALPHEVGNLRQMTFAAWLRWRGGGVNQRIFDFGNSTEQYVGLTPSDENGQLSLCICNGETVQTLVCDAAFPKNSWHHIAVTMSDTEVTIYVDGEVWASTGDITLRPRDFSPGLCYLGRSQFANSPFLVGYIDDVQIYNHALTAGEILAVMNGVPTAVENMSEPTTASVVATHYYTLGGQPALLPTRGLYILRQTRADGSVTTKKVLR